MFRSTVVNGIKWQSGVTGAKPPAVPTVLVVCQNPMKSEAENDRPFSSQANDKLVDMMRAAGLNVDDCYFTYAVRYATYENRTPTGGQIKECRQALLDEIAEMRPRMVVALGATAFRAVMGGGFKLTDFIGAVMEHKQLEGVRVFPLWAPSYILRNPQHENQFVYHLAALKRHLSGEEAITGESDVHYEVCESDEQMAQLALQMCQHADSCPGNVVSIDCETNSLCWGDPGGFIRTVQVCMQPEKAYVIRLMPTAGETPAEGMMYDDASVKCVSREAFTGCMATALRLCPALNFVTHNGRFEVEWLLTYGIDLRERIAYDTMLAEHLINNTSMLGLDALALKYTNLGKYDGMLNKWKKEHADMIRTYGGYAAVPEAILFPYGAADVIATLLSFKAQLPELQPYLSSLGPGLPGLFQLVLDAEQDMYEMELNGLGVDLARVDELVGIYGRKRDELRTQFNRALEARGFKDFNHNSVHDIRKLLFGPASEDGKTGGLGLTPITTTKPVGGQQRKWEWVMRQAPHVQANYTPSTGKQTLQILENQHPMVCHLLNLRRVDIICKNFFRDDDEGGIKGNLWPDGKLHPRFGQCSDSGRLRSSAPNCQNWSKQSERFLLEIFGKESLPYPMRSIAVAPPGMLFIEGDLKQAELFIMGGLSGDTSLLGDLTTPGKDLHTSTTLRSFMIRRLMSDGTTEVEEPWLLDLAVRDPREYEALEKTFIYELPDGSRLSHKQFKEGIRVAGKAVNFGIAYGRGAVAIQQQVFAETGVDIPPNEIAAAINVWKTETYPVTWDFLSRCQEMAVNPGYVENAWGRRRYFPKVDDEAVIAANRREAGNHPIQSTVADMMRFVCRNLRRLRIERSLGFRLVNQIHDAVLLLVPEGQVDAVKSALREAVETVAVPLPYGGGMTLQADLEVGTRWGEKIKN